MTDPAKLRIRPAVALAALLLASCDGSRPEPKLTIEEPWARSAAPGKPSSAAYFSIANSGGEDRLLSVSTPAATPSIHSTSMEGGVMRMRPLDGLEIPANSTVVLKPGGTHVMLTDLRQPLDAGSGLPMTLRFQRSGELRLTAEVRAAGARR